MNILETISNTLPSSVRKDGGPLLVALSGGADSVCLLLALQQLGFGVVALHCNFELRGTESDADEAFCRRLCRAKGIEISVRHFRTRSYAQRNGISIEMAARRLRYDWFREEVQKREAQAVCVAHHRDDSVETFLLNLIRGTGIQGLTGMKTASMYASDCLVLRPMLTASRADIETWLTEQGQTWVTEGTNGDPDAAQRNKVRLQLLPLMEEMNPRVRETLVETAGRMADVRELYLQAVDANRRRVMTAPDVIDIPALQQAPAPRTLLHEFLSPLGFNADQVREVYEGLDGESGRLWTSPTHRLLRDRDRLVIESLAPGSEAEAGGVVSEWTLPLEGLLEASGRVRLLVRRQSIDPATYEIPREAHTACFDLQKLNLPLTLRPYRQGDRFRPFGMNGTRLVSDLLTDDKLSLFQKERQMVVTSGGQIVWVVGRRVAAGYEVDEQTRQVMTLTVL